MNFSDTNQFSGIINKSFIYSEKENLRNTNNNSNDLENLKKIENSALYVYNVVDASAHPKINTLGNTFQNSVPISNCLPLSPSLSSSPSSSTLFYPSSFTHSSSSFETHTSSCINLFNTISNNTDKSISQSKKK
jgi:hypothetical protein